MWQAEADTELTLSASPTTAVGQKALALAKRRYSTVQNLTPKLNSNHSLPFESKTEILHMNILALP